jgi:uncharacterized protein YbcI
MADESHFRRPAGELAAEISNGMVKTVARYTGRGPTKARTTVGRDTVFVVLADTLTKGERSLVDAGFTEHVLDTRRHYQKAMEADAIAMVERLTGRTVTGFMSDNHVDPDLGAEIFVLAPDGAHEHPEEGSSTDVR